MSAVYLAVAGFWFLSWALGFVFGLGVRAFRQLAERAASA